MGTRLSDGEDRPDNCVESGLELFGLELRSMCNLLEMDQVRAGRKDRMSKLEGE